jgi:hypothetical protein
VQYTDQAIAKVNTGNITKNRTFSLHHRFNETSMANQSHHNLMKINPRKILTTGLLLVWFWGTPLNFWLVPPQMFLQRGNLLKSNTKIICSVCVKRENSVRF